MRHAGSGRRFSHPLWRLAPWLGLGRLGLGAEAFIRVGQQRAQPSLEPAF